MRKFLSLLLLCGLCSGCLTWIPGFEPDDPPALAVGKTIAGYGRVNAWALDEKTLSKDLAACDKAGVDIYHIEFLSWARYNPNGNQEMMKRTEECYKLALKECRARGMWLFVSFANANTGSGKYGDPGIPLSSMKPLIEWGIGVIKANGPKNVLFQPMAETGGGYPAQLEVRLIRELAPLGFVLVNNHGSRPKNKGGCHWAAWHPWKITDLAPADQLVVSDTGMIIQQLCFGLEGAGKPDTAKAWAKRYKDKGNPAIVFYHFKYEKHDEATIKAMGAGVK